MGQVYSELDDRLMRFISEQPMFFVATAPSLAADGAGGHVNLSPKGYRDTLAIIDPLTVAYLDLTGSGAETIAHVRQNGRITLMFCSFGRAPKILRIYGTGQIVLTGDRDWPELAARFPAAAGQGTGRGNQRAIVVVHAERIADSCGYAGAGDGIDQGTRPAEPVVRAALGRRSRRLPGQVQHRQRRRPARSRLAPARAALPPGVTPAAAPHCRAACATND